ncbi:MAG: hypothetical protein NT075_11200 [Chloroflexi bacterium]|nr:hypothetical protein [Chloroflexota bacterium]
MAHTRTIDELLVEIFEDQPHPLRAPFTTWLTTSKRFRIFVETYRTKIRAKLKAKHDAESLRDLAFELTTAYRLLQEPRLNLAYEPHDPDQARRPDFAVTFTTKFTFSVEVTRMQATPTDDPERQSNKLQHVIAGKLAQMLPGRLNVLIIGVDENNIHSFDVNAAMLQLKKRADTKDAQLFSRSGSRNAADFFRAYQRLSAILLCSAQVVMGNQPAIVWVNKEARHPLPANLQTILKTQSEM